MVLRKKRRGKGGKERRRREEEGKRKGPYFDACRDGAPSRSQKFFASGGACGGLVRTVLFAREAGKIAIEVPLTVGLTLSMAQCKHHRSTRYVSATRMSYGLLSGDHGKELCSKVR